MLLWATKLAPAGSNRFNLARTRASCRQQSQSIADLTSLYQTCSAMQLRSLKPCSALCRKHELKLLNLRREHLARDETTSHKILRAI